MTTIRGSDSVLIGRQRIDWGDLRVFLAVVESGSFSGAAKALGITQPTVSRRIEELEAKLHAQLIVRSLNGVALTDAGTAIHDHVVTMERSAQAIERLAMGQDKRDEGRVRLSAPDGLAAFWRRALRSFTARIPRSRSRSTPAFGRPTRCARKSMSGFSLRKISSSITS
jgi:DNA-binding transcriptional LysR family regulator